MPRATRSISVFLIALFACSGLAFAGTAGASTPATKASATSCAALLKKFDGVSNVSPSRGRNPKDLGKLFGKASDAFKQLGKKAPGSLKGSFNRIAKAYAGLKNIDFSNPASVGKLTTFSKTIGKDLTKVSKYFANSCKS